MNYQKKSVTSTPGKEAAEGVGARFIVDVLLDCAPAVKGSGKDDDVKPTPCPPGTANGELKVLPVLLPNLDGISSIRIYIAKVTRCLVWLLLSLDCLPALCLCCFGYRFLHFPTVSGAC